MNKKPIRLTEQDLHFLVENAVQAYLTENGMDEGFFGGLGALGSKFGNRMKTAGQNMSNAASQKWGQAKNAIGQAANAVGQKVNQAGQAMGQAYNNAKNTYQTGSANQDAQKAIQNAVQALNNLKAADQKLQSMGQYSVIGRQMGLIDNLIKVLSQGGATSVSGRFQNRRNAFTN
jgi:hypothetical protein